MFANSRKQMVFTFPYKLAVRFSYARTPFEVHTPENVYHTDANIRMQQRFKLRCTHDQSRRQIATQNDVLSPHPGKFLPFAHQHRNAMEIQTSAHTQPTSPLQCSHDLNNRYYETNSRLRSYLLCYNPCFIPLQASGVLLNNFQLKTILIKIYVIIDLPNSTYSKHWGPNR